MCTLKNQYGKTLYVLSFDDFKNFIESISDEKWSSGSGDICLINNKNGFYISISKMTAGDRFIITSAKDFGEDTYVYVSSKRYTN